MTQTFIVGRNGNQPFQIAAGGVSREHAEISIDEAGHWHVRDLDSTNGTYVRTEDGSFIRIGSKDISEDTILRLGEGSYQCFTFMAHRVLAQEGDYSYEFIQLRKTFRQQEEREARVKAVIEKHKRIILYSTIVAALPLLVGAIADLSERGALQDIMNKVNVFRMALVVIVPMILRLIYSGDEKKLRDTVALRKSLFVCPKCGQILTEYNIHNMTCPYCKAK